ncbi:proteoglycan 4-like isoform X1 [Pomacea canaliculata]|uniref:proteoglycan 4-like isoform X1 n=1 Tax=Pomacea canaliculata TaxID=400727 RepID=UPI000D72B09F|nr:proteoglycan 4-like isoform X1 [Pomacea canaliculata]
MASRACREEAPAGHTLARVLVCVQHPHRVHPSLATTMTPEEKRECRCLLRFLSYEDLVSLKDTVVGRTFPVKKRREMINVIIRGHSSAGDLLRRKKIQREILFRYLESKLIPVTSRTEKSVLITKVLALWTSQQPFASNTYRGAPTSQRSTSRAATASNTSRASPTSHRSASRAAPAYNTSRASPTSHRSASRAAPAYNTSRASPTSHRSTSRAAPAYNTSRASPTSHRSASRAATASNTSRAAPTSDRYTSRAAPTSDRYTSRAAPTSDRYTSRAAPTSDRYTSRAAPTSDRYTSRAAPTSDRYTSRAAPTSDRYTSRASTASNQPLHQDPRRTFFYKYTKTTRSMKVTRFIKQCWNTVSRINFLTGKYSSSEKECQSFFTRGHLRNSLAFLKFLLC